MNLKYLKLENKRQCMNLEGLENTKKCLFVNLTSLGPYSNFG